VLYPLDDVATCVSVTHKIRSFPKIFLGTFQNAAAQHLESTRNKCSYLCTEESAKCQTFRCCTGLLHRQQFKAFSDLDTALLSRARQQSQRTGRVFSIWIKMTLHCIITCPNASYSYHLKERNCSARKIPV